MPAARRGRASRVQRLAALLALVFGLGCGAGAPRPEAHFPNLDAFLASGKGKPGPRVVVIGIDGASWDYVLPLIQAGELPSLARMRREGASGRLRSVECHFTPPGWTTMFTGVLPERNGIYSFGNWDPQRRTFVKVNSNDVVAPEVWDVASRAGRTVAVVGVPVTYPPHPVNGVMVSGIMTPKTHIAPLALRHAPERIQPPDPSLRSYAPVLSAAFEDANNVLLPTFVDTRDDGKTRYDEVQLRVLRKGLGSPKRRTLGKYRFEVGQFSPWVRVRLSNERPVRDGWLKIRFDPPGPKGLTYLLTPTFLRIRHPYTYPPSLARQLERRFGYYLPHEFLSSDILPSVVEESARGARFFLHQKPWDLYLYVFGESDNAHHLEGFEDLALPIYRTIDRFIGEVLDSADPNTTVVVASDHGFGAYDTAVDLNQYLASLGVLRWKTPGVIDYDRTLVFHNMWHLYFNRQLLSAETLAGHGIPMRKGESPADALARYLIAAAREIHAPDGTRYPIALVREPSDAVGHAPDMAVQANPHFWVEFWNVDRPNSAIVKHLEGDARWKHARDGIVAAWGPGIRAGVDLGTVDIQDVAPTVLDLMGLPVADDFDGKPLPLRTTEVAQRSPLYRVDSYADVRRETVAAPEDEATFEETLRALGYVRD